MIRPAWRELVLPIVWLAIAFGLAYWLALALASLLLEAKP